MKRLKTTLSLLLAALLLAGCGGAESNGTSEATAETSGSEAAANLPTIDSIKLGEDYQDITATIHVLTNRTDVVDTVMPTQEARLLA